MYRVMLALCLTLFALPAAAQVSAGDICKAPGACRHIGSIPMEDAKGKVENQPVDSDFPWVIQENIMLFVGESVTVRLVDQGSYLAPVLVRSGAESEKTPLKAGEIRFTFAPSSMGQSNLQVDSAYPKTLDYAALAVNADGPKRTSVCSLTQGRTVFENWPYPIVQLALWHFVVTDEPGCKTIQWTIDKPKE